MKILTKEEEDQHYQAVLSGGLKGGGLGLGIGLASAYVLNSRTQFFRGLTLPLKTFFVTSTATFFLIVSAENASRAFGASRHVGAGYKDESALAFQQARQNMTTTQKALEWGRENRYKIVGASWVASMAGSLAWVYRDKYLTRSQKLVQARVAAQGLTLLVLIASAAFEISDSRSGRDVERIPDPTDPTHKRMIEKRVHHEHYKGEDLWMDMVKQEEDRINRRKEELKRAHEEGTKEIQKAQEQADKMKENLREGVKQQRS